MTLERRGFLHTAAVGAAALALSPPPSAAESRKIVLGIIGLGGMGSNHIRALVKRPGRRDRLGLRRGQESPRPPPPRPSRTAEEGPAGRRATCARCSTTRRVDAVFIATPDHWHAPAAILALRRRQARLRREAVLPQHPRGPADGRRRAAVRARSLQVGTQSRQHGRTSREAMDRIHATARSARCWWPRRGTASSAGTIGKSKPADPPAHLDYDLWLGPAPLVPYRPNLLPGIWRWWHDFGCGDIGNDGVHDIDVAALGPGRRPPSRRPRRLPGRQVLLRRRPAVPRHAVRRLRVPGRRQAGGEASS